MAAVCFYFQMHQPHRLRRYSVFDTEPDYFDTKRNTEILQNVAERCYAPATRILFDEVRENDDLHLSFSVTGVLLDQLAANAPQVIENLTALAETGRVEFLNETYYHSLAFLYSRDEFRQQLELHAQRIEDLFGQTPSVFRNTELIYNNDLAHYLSSLHRFDGVLAEGADQVLGQRSPTQVYAPPHANGIKLLLKHYPLSDDIAFRFSNREWPEWPLTVEKYSNWISDAGGDQSVINLFLDFETFGEHQWEQTGIFDFLKALPDALHDAGHQTLTCSQALQHHAPSDVFDAPHMISWADTERDLSAWLGNAMQSNALHELFKLEQPVKASGDPKLLEDWRRLTTSDHFYYMCTKYFADGDVHKYFNPYESPYDSYINFMNVLDNLRSRAGV